MPARPFYPRYPADYLAKTALLTLEEHGFYNLILDNLWLNDGELPSDPKELSIILRCSLRQTRRLLSGKLEANFEQVSGKLSNKRMTAELAKVVEKQRVASENGKKGNARRWSGGDAEKIANHNHNHNHITDSCSSNELRLVSQDEKPNKKKPPPPYKTIVDLYHELMPNNPQVLKLNEKRRRQIKNAWNDENGNDLESWKSYFVYCNESKFLTGRAATSPGRKVFIADLEWITNSTNMLKIEEGTYHR